MGNPAFVPDSNELAELRRDVDETAPPREDYYDKADRLRDERKGEDDGN